MVLLIQEVEYPNAVKKDNPQMQKQARVIHTNSCPKNKAKARKRDQAETQGITVT